MIIRRAIGGKLCTAQIFNTMWRLQRQQKE